MSESRSDQVQSYNLFVCSVCSAWHKISLDPSLWSVVNLTRQKMSSHLLSTTVQKQPTGLVLDWTNLGKQHLNWLLPRIPQTKQLSLAGLDFTLTVSSLNTSNCPLLQVRDLTPGFIRLNILLIPSGTQSGFRGQPD